MPTPEPPPCTITSMCGRLDIKSSAHIVSKGRSVSDPLSCTDPVDVGSFSWQLVSRLNTRMMASPAAHRTPISGTPLWMRPFVLISRLAYMIGALKMA